MSRDCRYGGPQRVAESHKHGLTGLPVRVTFLAITDPLETSRDEELKLFKSITNLKKRKFANQFSPALWAWFFGHRKQFDLVHLHFSRDLVTTPIALMCLLFKQRYVIQPHGMLQGPRGKLKTTWDAFITKPILQNASRVFFLTQEEREHLRNVFGVLDLRLERLVNGSEVLPLSRAVSANPLRNVILYASRLDQRKRPLAFADLARIRAVSRPDLEFLMVGSDSGALNETLNKIEAADLPSLKYLGAVNETEIRLLLDRCIALVQPALWDVFPMIMVEAACRGIPVVSVEGYEVSDWFGMNSASIVSDGTPEGMDASLSIILSNFEALQLESHSFASTYLDQKLIGKQLEETYKKVLGTIG